MGIFDRFKNNITVTKYEMVTDQGGGYYAWSGNLYQSDIVRAAIRPKVRAIGKAIAKHVRDDANGLKINPEPYMRFLLEEPNPYMTGQMLQEKLATQLELNNNAFALIQRDDNGMPISIYPIVAGSCDLLRNKSGELFLKFYIKGKPFTFRYGDIIHLRKDFNENEIFGESPATALTPLMEIVNTTDQGIVKAIKNSNVVRWLLKYNASLRPEDLEKNTKQFVKSFLNTETSEVVGVAATDVKADATQIEPKDYVPNAIQMDKTTQRILSFFNTNIKIVQASYSEDEWISYYETSIEPDITQMSGEFTRKLFSRRQRGFGNKIMFESSSLTFASMQTKLGLAKFVELGIFNANEVRKIMNYAPRDGGDEYVRRLDTRPTNE